MWVDVCYDQICRPASPKLLLGLDLGLGCYKKYTHDELISTNIFLQTGFCFVYLEIEKKTQVSKVGCTLSCFQPPN